VHKRVLIPSLTISLIFLCASASAQAGKLAAIEGPPDSAMPNAIKEVLDAKGYRVILDDGSVACDIWLRKSLPAQPKKEAPGAIYTELGESTLVGVISFPHSTTDYRGDTIQPGVYTLRYELIPNDGNHLGVAPNRDFLLLIPASSDSDPNSTLKFGELIELSRKATGTRHPAPLNLVQAAAVSAAAVSKDDEEHWIFSAALKLATGGTMPFALVVKGTAPQ